MARSKRLWPLLIAVTGLCLLIGGFIYDVMFAGIPYQDPTPEMAANYAQHSNIASVIRWTGLGIIVFGCALRIIFRDGRQSRQGGVAQGDDR